MPDTTEPDGMGAPLVVTPCAPATAPASPTTLPRALGPPRTAARVAVPQACAVPGEVDQGARSGPGASTASPAEEASRQGVRPSGRRLRGGSALRGGLDGHRSWPGTLRLAHGSVGLIPRAMEG